MTIRAAEELAGRNPFSRLERALRAEKKSENAIFLFDFHLAADRLLQVSMEVILQPFAGRQCEMRARDRPC